MFFEDDESHSTFEAIKSVGINQRIGVALSNCAHVLSTNYLEVSSISPSCSPRVLNIPEGSIALNSITSSQNSVVYILGSGSTVINSVDSAHVILEAVNDLEGNSNGASAVKSLCELDFISLSDVVASMSYISNRN